MLAVHDPRFDAELSGSLDLRGAGIDARDFTSHFQELRGQGTIAAAEIEDAFACARSEQLDDRRAELGDEAGVASVTVGIPGLCVGQ
jgi:hypothetical protein